MKICIIAEGSYPYILGGVSSWINSMIRSFSEYDFIIFSISDSASKKGKYKYEIPSNVIKIVDVFLDEIDIDNCVSGRKYNLEPNTRNAFYNLLCGESSDWNRIFSFFKSKRIKNISEFFLSLDFYNIVYDVYKTKYQYTPFTEFLWNIRSMYLILFYILSKDIPKADIYHSVSTGYAGVVAAFGKFLYNKPFILSEHGIYTREREEEIIKAQWIKEYHKGLWKNFFISLSSCAYEKSDIVTSLFLKNKILQSDIGCPEDKIVIIPNGIDVSVFDNILEKTDQNVINIGAVVRVVPIKDIKTMIFSFKVVKSKVPNAKFYIMGPVSEDEDYYNECLELVKDISLEDCIFTGSVNIKDYIGRMDIMVLTSISEGQPLALMESMAAKKPSVCTNVGDCSGLIYGDGDSSMAAGFIDFVTDYDGIAKSIVKLCEDENLRIEMGMNGYNRILNLYTKDRMIMSYRKIYESFKGD